MQDSTYAFKIRWSLNVHLVSKDHKSLCEQVEHVITEIHIERHQTEVQTDQCQTLREKFQDEYTLRMQLCKRMEEMQKELAEVKSQQESLVC